MKLIFIMLFFVFQGVLLSPYCFSKDLIPVEHFTWEPRWHDIELSPDGDKLLAVVGEKDLSSVVSYEFESQKYEVLLKTDREDWRINWKSWLDNENYMLYAGERSRNRRYKTFYNYLFIGDYKGDNLKRIIDHKSPVYPVRQIVNWLSSDLNSILIRSSSLNDRNSIYRFNIKDASRDGVFNFGVSHERLITVPNGTYGWVGDSSGTYFAGYSLEKGVKTVYYRNANEASQEKRWVFDVFDLENNESGVPNMLDPIGFHPGKPLLYATGLYDGRKALYSIDMEAEEQKFNLVAFDEKYDLCSCLLTSPADNRPVGINVMGPEPRAIYWDDVYKKLHAQADKALGGFNSIISMSRDENKYILRHMSSEYPSVYFIGNQEKNTLEMLGYRYPQLGKLVHPKKELRVVKARDGVEIEVFITKPLNSKLDKTPVVVYLHPGPFHKTSRNFELMPAFLASRGYAVMQVNYRGSAGYGYEFIRKIKRDVGTSTQNDILDAVDWLKAKKWVDTSRLCVMGRDFGGYLSLMSVANPSGDFKCAISVSGITDLVDWIDHKVYTNGYEEAFMSEYFGRRWSDGKQLKEDSPMSHVAKIKQPVLLVHGEHNVSIPSDQSEDFYRKLKKTNKNVQYMEIEDGGSYFDKYEERLKYFKKVESFLERYL